MFPVCHVSLTLSRKFKGPTDPTSECCTNLFCLITISESCTSLSLTGRVLPDQPRQETPVKPPLKPRLTRL